MSTPLRSTALAAALLSACSQSQKPTPVGPVVSNGAEVVFARVGATETRLFAQPESGGEAIALTPAGARAEFGGTAGKRVIYGVLAADGTLAAVRAVGLDGQGDAALGTLAPAAFRGLRGLHVTGDGSLVLELARASGARELRIARGSAPLAAFASGSWLGEAAGVIAYLANAQSLGDGVGDVRAIRLDGSADRLLGAGGGDDQFHGFAGASAVLTAHRSGATEVRSVPLDGSAAKVRAGSRGVLFFSGGALVAARGAALEKLDASLAATTIALPAGTTALAVLPDGRVAGFAAGSGLLAADSAKATVLDATDATSALAAHVLHTANGDRLVYTANGATGSFLRSARLDGGGAALLAEGHGQEVLFTSALSTGRIVFYKTKGNEPGGWLHSVRAEGGDERMLGDGASGTLTAADHDFGGVTKAGRIVFEAELVDHQPPQLFVVEPDGAVRGLTGGGSYATLSAIVE